jgi:uncharacterized membrane protein
MTLTSAFLLTIATGMLTGLTACDQEPKISYQNDVAPILSKYCDECHLSGGEGTANTGFVVESYDTVMQGTNLGPVVVAGDAISSTLYRLVAGEVDESIQMPHEKQEKLTEQEVMVLQQWIDQGAQNN